VKITKMKKAIVLGGGGFIGGHLAKRLKNNGYHVRIADCKYHEYFEQHEICDEFILCDLTDSKSVELVITENCDELYQLAADMGGAMYIFTGLNDANVMHNSALINLNVAAECVKKKVKQVFYSSSACIYPSHNQLNPNDPNCEESSAYPADPDSEYGWEKLFSERLYLAFHRNSGLDIRIARFHNIFGPYGTWRGGREKAPAAMCRKVCEAKDGDSIEVWGDGLQTRSFLFIDDCLDAIEHLMKSDFIGPVNVGSEEMISINELAEKVISFSGKNLKIKNLFGQEFYNKYGFNCPLGVRGRNSSNKLFFDKIGWSVSPNLLEGLKSTYKWVNIQNMNDK
jgi:GDP-D-mannose 3',5'-epimerase